MEIAQKHLDAAARSEACEESLGRYTLGMDVSEVEFSDLVWCEDNLPVLAQEAERRLAQDERLVRGTLSLCLHSRSGYGYGSGHGDGKM